MSESKQEIVVRMVKAGQFTRAQIKEEADCTSGALASYLSTMANAAKFTGSDICPIEIENEAGDKIFVAKTFDEVQKIKEERSLARGPAAAKKTPEERLEAAEKRLSRSESTLDKLNERISAYDGKDEAPEELALRHDKAIIEVRLAELEYEKAKDLVSDVEDDEEEGNGVESDDDLM